MNQTTSLECTEDDFHAVNCSKIKWIGLWSGKQEISQYVSIYNSTYASSHTQAHMSRPMYQKYKLIAVGSWRKTQQGQRSNSSEFQSQYPPCILHVAVFGDLGFSIKTSPLPTQVLHFVLTILNLTFLQSSAHSRFLSLRHAIFVFSLKNLLRAVP